MNVAERSFAREVLTTTAGVVVLLAAVVALVDGVELARRFSVGEIDATTWFYQLLGRLPGRVAAALPIATALGAARVGTAWAQSGRLVAVCVCGIRPSRLAWAAVAGALAAGAGVAGAREAAAPWASRAIAGQGTWVVLPGPAPDGLPPSARAHVRAQTLARTHAIDVDISWTVDGAVVGRGSAARAAWDGRRWIEPGRATVWIDGAARDVPLVLPDPGTWREAAAGAGADASLIRLWTAPPSPGRSAWLAERLATPVGAAVLAGAAVPLVWSHRRWGTGVVLAVAVVWRMTQGGALAVAARGQFGLVTGVGLPLLAAGLLAAWLFRWLDRRSELP